MTFLDDMRLVDKCKITRIFINNRVNMIYSSNMIEASEGKVGSKGELFPPLKLRRKLGLEPGRRVIYTVLDGRLIVDVVRDVKTLLAESKPKVVATLDELKRDRVKLAQEAES